MTAHAPADCPSLADLEVFLDAGEPPGALGSHVSSCVSCRDRVEEIRANNELLARLPSRDGGDDDHGHDQEHPLRDAVPGYRIREEIHRGGQGVVYRALQVTTNRVVALKVLLAGAFATPEQRRRFEREVDLAAGLQHPNVVTVFDGGRTGDDRLWCAMELIDGERLDHWIERRGPDLERDDVLRLFAKICAAVTHAHQRGIIHRDLKPANIIVDAGDEPRVLDFGLARPAGMDLDEDDAGRTMDGSFLGTIAWCSPEQARGDTAAVDVRSDVYALGVIIHELIAGRLPYDVIGPLGEVLDRIATTDPAPLRGGAGRFRVDRDLETVILTALAKDPRRRYQSADEMRRDVEHVLADEPIDARRDSRWYVLVRTVRRHRLAAAAALGFVLLLAAFGVSMTIMYGRARAEADKFAKINIFLEDTLGSVQPGPGQSEVTVGALLVEGEHWIELVLADDPEVEAAVQAIIGNGYRNIGRFPEAERLLLAALDTRQREFGPDGIPVARSLSALGHLRREQGAHEEAERLFEEALAIRTAALGPRDLDTAMTRASLARVYRDAGRLDEADATLGRVLEVRRAALGDAHPDVAMTHFGLGRIAELRGDLDEALRRHETALAARRETLHREHPDLPRSLLELGRLEMRRGHPDRARPYLEEGLALRRQSLPEGHWMIAETLGELGWCLVRLGLEAEGAELVEQASAVIARERGAEAAAAMRAGPGR